MMDIPYKIVRSKRKTVAIHITPAGNVELRCPMGLPIREAERILESKRPWIETQLAKHRANPALPPYSASALEEMKKALLPKVEERVKCFAPIIGVDYGRITIRSQKSLWGSCSRTGNLSFNCLLSQVPDDVLDYVVVHELCHRKQMNHSPAFWAQVERVLPGYRAQRQWLKEQGGSLIRRISNDQTS